MRKLFSLFPFFSWLSMFSESWQIKPKPWIIWNLKIENWNLCQVWRWVVTNTNRTNQANHVLRKQRKQGYPNESETFAFLCFPCFLCELKRTRMSIQHAEYADRSRLRRKRSHGKHGNHGNFFLNTNLTNEHECRRYRELLASGHANGEGWQIKAARAKRQSYESC